MDSVSNLEPKLLVEAGRRTGSANGIGGGNVIGLDCKGGLAGYMSFGNGYLGEAGPMVANIAADIGAGLIGVTGPPGDNGKACPT